MDMAGQLKSTGRRKSGRGKSSRGVSDEILKYRERDIVLDTDSFFLFIGKLDDVRGDFIVLRDADVHDRRESPSMNEKYLIESKKFGIRVNRKLVHIRIQEVISLSLLDDIVEY